jgi:hypothetical protein
VGLNDTKTELDKKLIILGERVVERALYYKAESKRTRELLTIVFQHINESPIDLQSRLRDALNKPMDSTPADREAMINKLVR